MYFSGFCAKSVGLHVSSEVVGAYGPDNSERTDLFIRGIEGNTNVDVVTTCPSCSTYCDKASRTPLYAAELAARRKRTKYLSSSLNMGVAFLPLSFELPGAWEKDMVSFFRSLVKLAAPSVGARTYSSYWRAAISITIQRGVSWALANFRLLRPFFLFWSRLSCLQLLFREIM